MEEEGFCMTVEPAATVLHTAQRIMEWAKVHEGASRHGSLVSSTINLKKILLSVRRAFAKDLSMLNCKISLIV